MFRNFPIELGNSVDPFRIHAIKRIRGYCISLVLTFIRTIVLDLFLRLMCVHIRNTVFRSKFPALIQYSYWIYKYTEYTVQLYNMHYLKIYINPLIISEIIYKMMGLWFPNNELWKTVIN